MSKVEEFRSFFRVYNIQKEDKCERVAKNIEAEAVLLTDSNSVSWLLNLRNKSAEYTFCILCRAILYKNANVDLFIQDKEHSTLEANFDNHINVLILVS